MAIIPFLNEPKFFSELFFSATGHGKHHHGHHSHHHGGHRKEKEVAVGEDYLRGIFQSDVC